MVRSHLRSVVATKLMHTKRQIVRTVHPTLITDQPGSTLYLMYILVVNPNKFPMKLERLPSCEIFLIAVQIWKYFPK